MQQLIGLWEGTGVASYPTIETTEYREVLRYQQQDDEVRLYYEQKTWRIVAGEQKILHWESGFIRQIDDDDYEWINSQNNGRVEVMKGTLTATDNGLELKFETVTFANDPRMKTATRSLIVSGDELRYEPIMATQTHEATTLHLEARLKRK